MMPILVRGIRSANYELVKKATVCTSNLCALIKDASDVAPFVPSLLPLLEENLEHSSPDVREGAASAKEKLEAGAGGRADPSARPSAVASAIAAGFDAGSAPAEVLTRTQTLSLSISLTRTEPEP